MVDVSIIVPVYNVEQYLRKCLDSILHQEGIEFEVIAVDDGSKDGCAAILDEYAIEDKRLKVVHQENAGVSIARNNGISLANGKWLYFVDSDDWLEKDVLSMAVDTANSNELDVLFVDCFERYETGKTNRVHLFADTFMTSEASMIERIQNSIICHKRSPFFSKGADNAYPAPWSKLIRATIVEENNIQYNPEVDGVYDDGLFTLEVIEHAKKIGYAAICLYNYRILYNSIVHAYRESLVERFEKNCRQVEVFSKKYNKTSEFMKAEYARRIAYLSSFLSSYFFSLDNKRSNQEKMGVLSEALERDVWKKAIEHAYYKDLETKHKYTLFCMKHKLLLGLKLYSLAKKCIR